MSSLGSKTTAAVFTLLSASVPSSATSACLHGFPVDVATSTGGEGEGEGEDYPYNKRAAFVLQRLLDKILHNPSGENFHIIARAVVCGELHDEYMSEHDARIDENLVKSCVMLGTELLQQSTGRDWMETTAGTGADMKLSVATHLAAAILYMEVLIERTDAKFRHMAEELANLDSPRNVIRFFDSRNPCSCLDRLKEMHTERLGGCGNPSCKYQRYGPDKRLLTCSACKVAKYCCKECQVADRPNHKGACKMLAKELARQLAAKQSQSG